MGVVDPQYIPALQQDWRYTRLLNLTRRLAERRQLRQRLATDLQRLLEARMPRCGNCGGDGEFTARDDTGQEYTVPCAACQGSGEKPEPPDNEDDGKAGQ